MTTPTEAVEILNRVPCNTALADDPTVQVGPSHDPAVDHRQMVVGLLGIINGLFGIVPNGKARGYIAAHYDDAGALTHFAELT